MNNKTPAKHRDIFCDTLFAKKAWRRRGSNPHLLAGKHEKFQAPTGFEPTTYWLGKQ